MTVGQVFVVLLVGVMLGVLVAERAPVWVFKLMDSEYAEHRKRCEELDSSRLYFQSVAPAGIERIDTCWAGLGGRVAAGW